MNPFLCDNKQVTGNCGLEDYSLLAVLLQGRLSKWLPMWELLDGARVTNCLGLR